LAALDAARERRVTAAVVADRLQKWLEQMRALPAEPLDNLNPASPDYFAISQDGGGVDTGFHARAAPTAAPSLHL